MRIRAVATAVIALTIAASSAWAAPPLPHSLQPAITAPGGIVEVHAPQSGVRVALAGPAEVVLEVAWRDSPIDGIRARCTVPADAAPGRYDLVVGDARRAGAVWVLESIPNAYRIAFVSGSTPGDLARTAAMAAEVEAIALVFVGAGDADTGESAAYLSAVREAPLPVIVTGVDAQAESPYPFAAALGGDTLLFHDPRVTRLGAVDGELHRLRRATRASRWSIAVWPYFDPLAGYRSQLTLFADDPVDLFVAPLERIPESPEDAPLPGFWPRVRFEPLVTGAADTLLVVEVSAAPLRSRRVPVAVPDAP